MLDVRLGDDDGLDTLEQLRDEGVLDGVPIGGRLGLRRHRHPLARHRGRRRVFVPKPFSPGRLQAIVEELLQAR